MQYSSNMVCLNILAILAIIGVALPSTLATDWVVGDAQGWGLSVDYTAWASGKTFLVGDNLIFNYEQGSHDVVNVTGTDFQQCTESAGAIPLTSGHDVITLAVAGNHWYICDFPEHCLVGMNLVVDVLLGTPAKSLSKYPAKSPPKYPTKSPLKSPAKSLPKSPSKSLPKSPVESPSESPIESPTESPTKSPVESPTESPTNSHSSGALAPHRQQHMVLRGH